MPWSRWVFALACLWGAWNWYSTRPLSDVPPGIAVATQPEQTTISEPTFQHEGFDIEPLARLELRARVLSKENYRLDAGAKLSPTDLFLGWGAMSDPQIYQQLSISQGNRFAYYRYSDAPPIPVQQIIRSSANMHLIPANKAVKVALKKVRPGQLIHMSGLLIRARAASGWQWSSSLTREDTGAGACEVIWVQQLSQVTSP